VRQRDGVEQEERVILVGSHPAQRLVGNQVLSVGLAHAFPVVAGQLETLIVAVQVRRKVAVRVSLAVVAEEVIEADLQRAAAGVKHAHAPLADTGRGIALIFQQAGHGQRPGGQRHLALGLDLAVGPDWTVARVQAGHQRRTGRGTDAGPRIGLQIAGAFPAQPIQVRSLDQLLAVDAHVSHRQVVGQDEDQVGFGGGAFARVGLAHESAEQAEHDQPKKMRVHVVTLEIGGVRDLPSR